ncbi:MAG: 23S rRNA (guanosine(2251)-2'-O)-methyltransferase RlmB [Acidobacteria bacterium]|nr:23S rRNA (guanosine(2251)-2'-O)-methyltransferase RlmB [Acidobacteriota bacterium]
MRVYGMNPTMEALRAGRVTEIRLGESRRRGTDELLALAARHGVRVRRVARSEIDRLSGHVAHQGVLATVRRPVDVKVSDLLDGPAPPLIVVLDGIEDPRNLGAVARTAAAAGASGIVLQTRRSAATTGAAVKASAGTITHVRLAPVVNVSRALDALKAAGVWAVGLDAGARRSLYDLDLRGPTALVVGSEGRGLRRLVRERCDWLAALPMRPEVASLNVSVAAGIALFEAVRQRRASDPRARSGARPPRAEPREEDSAN